MVPADSVYLHRFAVNTNIDHSFRIEKADQPHPGTAMFFFIPSPTYVGGSTFHVTFTMLCNGSTIQW